MARLHGFQRKLLNHIKQGGNDFIVASTGSGRTRIAKELSAPWLVKISTSRTFLLINTVPLAHQQAGNSLKIKSSGPSWSKSVCEGHCYIGNVYLSARTVMPELVER